MIQAIIMMLIVGGVLGLVLGFADKVFYVAIDERTAQVTELLPGYNCGACGYPGCAGLAIALVSGEADTPTLCKPSKPEQRIAIAEYLSTTPGPDGETITVKV